jgi:hypothetical protein
MTACAGPATGVPAEVGTALETLKAACTDPSTNKKTIFRALRTVQAEKLEVWQIFKLCARQYTVNDSVIGRQSFLLGAQVCVIVGKLIQSAAQS